MIFDKVKTIINEQLGVNEDEITMESNFLEDFGADSLELIDLIMALESEFEIEVPEEDIEEIETVSDVVSYLKDHTDLED
ncbi:MAG TPA: acyl carrier protein [Clostridiales bacterium]|nr:acyl carrier protein [Clostridiales bacterium]